MSEGHPCSPYQNLEDDKVKLVAYNLVSIAPHAERPLSGGTLMVTEPMTVESFTAWIIGMYTQSLAKPPHGSLPPAKNNRCDPGSIPPPTREERRYLRVAYQVIQRWDKVPYDFEKEQVRALRRIGRAPPSQPENSGRKRSTKQAPPDDEVTS